MSPAADPAPVTSTALLARVRHTRSVAVAAETELLVLAAEWADAHPGLVDDPEPWPAEREARTWGDPAEEYSREFDEERGIPAWSWKASASFAAALGRSTASGDAFVRDALVLRHRLPRTWKRVVSCQLEAWRARRIAQAVLGAPDDVCDHLDRTVATIAHQVGPATLERLLDEAMLRLHPEEREIAQLEALEARHATLHEESISHTGVVEMSVRGDWKDLHDFDLALSEIAAALATVDQTAGRFVESHDVRRSRAVGVLADPAAAMALLEGRPPPKPRKHCTLVVHVSVDALLGGDPVARCATLSRPVLDQQVRDWCGRTDTHVTVQPVIDLADHTRSDAYEVPDRLRARNDLLHPRCVFPWCTRLSQHCDHDHRVPYDEGGETCDCNVAPLCRRHHRLKTHAGWRYTLLEPGVFLWSEPHGQQFLSDHTGTLDVTSPDRPVAQGSGCHTGRPSQVSATPPRDPP